MTRSWRSWVTMLAVSIQIAVAVGAGAQGVNSIRSIRTTALGIEVEVHSTEPFPVRALPPILRIGNKEFMRSRPPADGSLNTLIFILLPHEFAQVNNGDPVSVDHGPADLAPRRDFGLLNKRASGG